MKRHYLSLWALLACAFVIFAVASAFEMPEVFGHKLKSAGIADELLAQAYTTPATPQEDIDSLACELVDAYIAEADTVKHTILLVGDSMLEGIGRRLAAYADESGHTLYSVIWYSSTTEKWGTSDRLSSYITKINPTYIIICLGANELFVRDIAKHRAAYVDNIINQIGELPYLWIGPPNWKEDTGINDLIASKTPHGTFFRSKGMHFDRNKDGAHPTHASAALWVDSIARWIPLHARHKIHLEAPSSEASRPKRTFVHSPNE